MSDLKKLFVRHEIPESRIDNGPQSLQKHETLLIAQIHPQTLEVKEKLNEQWGPLWVKSSPLWIGWFQMCVSYWQFFLNSLAYWETLAK